MCVCVRVCVQPQQAWAELAVPDAQILLMQMNQAKDKLLSVSFCSTRAHTQCHRVISVVRVVRAIRVIRGNSIRVGVVPSRAHTLLLRAHGYVLHSVP